MKRATLPLLYLVHRIPCPPNKGDKIRSFHLLRFLARRYRVYLAARMDAPEDRSHLPALRALCADVCVRPLSPRWSRVGSLRGLATGEPLTLPYFRDNELREWVETTVRRQQIERAVVFSSAMAQYVTRLPQLRVVTDFVDVDSAKWAQYGRERPGLAGWVYRREGRRLAEVERLAALRSAASVFVSRAEAELFINDAPTLSERVFVIGNGVDTCFFSPDPAQPSPFAPGDVPLVFTGAMDYWPNIDAVSWFAREVFAPLFSQHPALRFYIVGMNPPPAVRALAQQPGVVVTGSVPDVRPYLQHACAMVAPLRVARGVQNKVLEAMAMARPVVVSAAAARGLGGLAGRDYLVAADAEEFRAAVVRLLDRAAGDMVGANARDRIAADYNWDANLARFVDLIEGQSTRGSGRQAG